MGLVLGVGVPLASRTGKAGVADALIPLRGYLVEEKVALKVKSRSQLSALAGFIV